jgi:CotH protein
MAMIRNLMLFFILLILNTSLYSQSQGLYDIMSIKEAKVYIDDANWLSTLDSLKQLGNDDRILGDVVLDGVRYDSVGIRFKGNSSYFNVKNQELTKLPFNIKADEVKKKQRFYDEYKSLKLSNIFRDPSYLREVLSYEIAGNYMPTPRANYVKLYVNDEYLGLYNNSESVDNDFLKEHFGWKKGTLFKCDPNWNAAELSDCPKGDKASLEYLGQDSTCYYSLYEIKSDNGWADLIQLTYILNEEIDSIESILNIDQVLWMHAFNNVLVNLDSYAGRLCHNYYLYRDSFGIFHPILWDMNLSFGGFRYDGLGSPLSDEKMAELSMFNHYKQKNEKRPLITNLLRDNFYRKIYVAHVKTIVDDYFSNKKYLERGELIQKLIDDEVKGDSNKLYSYEGFKQNLSSTAAIGNSKMIGIAELMEARTEYLTSHPLYTRDSPVISEVRYIGETEKNVIKAKVTDSEIVYLAYRLKKHAPFKRVIMIPDLVGDTYSAKIDNVLGTEYYIIAENDKCISLSPERASFEFYEINGTELGTK